jgi:Tfp pilus assembly protein PilV
VRAKGTWAQFLSRTLQKNVRASEQNAQTLLQHCAEEMQHLAGFLPALYQQFK